ncbi:hypothetical protein BH20CHL6_BH20CHL6_09120 [soil metagenome]
MRNTIGISPFMVIVSILVGGAIGGISGAFLAVPFVAACEVVLERLQARDTAVPIDPSKQRDTRAGEQRAGARVPADAADAARHPPDAAATRLKPALQLGAAC